MSTESTEALIERVLAEHTMYGGGDTGDEPECKCGVKPPETWWEEDFGEYVWANKHHAAAITQALAERDEIAACGRRHPGDCSWIGRGSPMPPICLQPESPQRANPDTTWAEDAAASHRALYDTDSGRRDNWSER